MWHEIFTILARANICRDFKWGVASSYISGQSAFRPGTDGRTRLCAEVSLHATVKVIFRQLVNWRTAHCMRSILGHVYIQLLAFTCHILKKTVSRSTFALREALKRPRKHTNDGSWILWIIITTVEPFFSLSSINFSRNCLHKWVGGTHHSRDRKW